MDNATVFDYVGGCFTLQMYLEGLMLGEIEQRVGFHKGRLSLGASFAIADELPGMDGFEFAGYNLVATHHTLEQYGEINKPQGVWEKVAYEKWKRDVLDSWKLFGARRLVKVQPKIPHRTLEDMKRDGKFPRTMDEQYPVGGGIPQWRITRPIRCRIITVKAYPGGRFLSDENHFPLNNK